MSILGIGVDVVRAPRIAAILKRRGQSFASKILSEKEYTRWRSMTGCRRSEFLAVRWCVKEAAYKALYPVVRPTWKELTYDGLGEAGQKPRLEYHPMEIPSTRVNVRMHVSVSHDGEYVFSSVLAEEET